MSHTPGPWKVRTYRRREGRVFEVAGGGGCLALATEFSQLNPEANTRLMAAAPELLEALKKLKQHVDYSEENQEAILQAATVIQHAEGQTQEAHL